MEEPTPEMMQAFEQAQSIVADFQQGMARRQQIDKIGKTLELLYAQAMREQKPVDFKTGMKQMVRRTCTTGVGYVELGFQREYGPRPGMTEKLADARARLDHMQSLTKKVTDEDNPVDPDDPEIAELQLSIEALQSEPEIVMREGLIFDYPQATRVIPDKLCRELVGFIGARHVTLEYMYTCDQVKELFGVDLEKNYTGYSPTGSSDEQDQLPELRERRRRERASRRAERHWTRLRVEAVRQAVGPDLLRGRRLRQVLAQTGATRRFRGRLLALLQPHLQRGRERELAVPAVGRAADVEPAAGLQRGPPGDAGAPEGGEAALGLPERGFRGRGRRRAEDAAAVRRHRHQPARWGRHRQDADVGAGAGRRSRTSTRPASCSPTSSWWSAPARRNSAASPRRRRPRARLPPIRRRPTTSRPSTISTLS